MSGQMPYRAALVTGGAKRLGKAMALALADAAILSVETGRRVNMSELL